MKIAAQTAPIFSARLTPHRSLSPKGMRIVVGIAALGALIPGLLFYLLGAWPVVGFMGLDVLALYAALRYSFRRSGLFEQVTLTREGLEVRRVFPSGFEATETYDPGEVRLIVERDFDERTTGLKLRTRQRDSEIGAFLSPADRSSFAKAFGRALRQARRSEAR